MGQAAMGSSPSTFETPVAKAGYHCLNLPVRVPSRTRVRVWSTGCAPDFDERICCRFAKRFPMTVLTVDSAKSRGHALAIPPPFGVVRDRLRAVGEVGVELGGSFPERLDPAVRSERLVALDTLTG